MSFFNNRLGLLLFHFSLLKSKLKHSDLQYCLVFTYVTLGPSGLGITLQIVENAHVKLEFEHYV